MKQKLYALDAFFIEKLKLSENDPYLKLTDTELYSFRTETKETLLHHLWECHFVKTLWIEALNNALQTNILLQP